MTAVAIAFFAVGGGIQAQCLTLTFVTHPQSQTAIVGSDVTFFVEATGTAPLMYQWRKDRDSVFGATGASFSIMDVAFSDAGTYDVIISNPCSAARSRPALLTVVPEPLDPDFNGDGKVDAADYVMWRKNNGTQQGYNIWRANFGQGAVVPLPGDFNDDGIVNAADYVFWRNSNGALADYDSWRAHFGQTAGSGFAAGAAVPEQATLSLFVVAAAVWCCLLRRLGSERRNSRELKGRGTGNIS